MKSLTFFLAALFVFSVSAQAAPSSHGSVGVGHGVQVPGKDSNPCGGTLLLNYDGSAENGFCWQYGGVVPPMYGAFAECYNYTGPICGIELNLTSIGNPAQPATLYLWADAGGMPGTVISQAQVTPSGVPLWPTIGVYDYSLGDYPNVSGEFWVGYWANFSNQGCGYFVAADLNGFGGCPMTNIAPGIGYPTGWNSASVVWGPVQSIGIGVWTGELPCGPNVRCGDPAYWPCCHPDGTCALQNEEQYCDGQWSPSPTCAPNPCLIGACCVPDGMCTITTQAGCPAPGTWVGPGITCAADPCAPTSGVSGRQTLLVIPHVSPNPAGSAVTISYGVPVESRVSVAILDATGHLVRNLLDATQGAGNHTVVWNRRDDAGRQVAAGMYFYRVQVAGKTYPGRIIALK